MQLGKTDPAYLSQNQNDLVIKVSNFLILNLLNILEHFAAVHLHAFETLIFCFNDFRVQLRLRSARVKLFRMLIMKITISLSVGRSKSIFQNLS